MEPFLEREEVTTTSRLVGILPDDPPRLNFVDCGTGRDGVKRHFAQQVLVLDKRLFARLQTEVKIGDSIRATVVNEYGEAGSRTYLSDFKGLSSADQEAPVKNGASNFVRSEIKEVVVAPPARTPKTAVKS